MLGGFCHDLLACKINKSTLCGGAATGAFCNGCYQMRVIDMKKKGRTVAIYTENQISKGIKALAGLKEESAQQDSGPAGLRTHDATRLRTTIFRFRSSKTQVWKFLKHGGEMLE